MSVGCVRCKEDHDTYGMEAEINAIEDSDIRHEVLGELNHDHDFDPYSAKYGIDGSDEPLEIRNINADDPRGLARNYKETLETLLGGIRKYKESHPGSCDKIMNSRACGIHIHQFHPGVQRDRMSASHSLIATLVNSLEPTLWASRVVLDYGLPFSCRDTAWCRTAHATELRMFNVLHPETLEACLELTSEIVNMKRDIVKSKEFICGFCGMVHLERMSDFLQEEYLCFQRTHGFGYSNMPRFAHGTLKFFVEKGFVTPPEIASLYGRVVKAYRPVFTDRKDEFEFRVREKDICVPRKVKVARKIKEVGIHA